MGADGKKKPSEVKTGGSVAQRRPTSATKNCINKYKHKNSFLCHLLCTWILYLIKFVLLHWWGKANFPQAPLGLSLRPGDPCRYICARARWGWALFLCI